jgi:hypothetical protein
MDPSVYSIVNHFHPISAVFIQNFKIRPKQMERGPKGSIFELFIEIVKRLNLIGLNGPLSSYFKPLGTLFRLSSFRILKDGHKKRGRGRQFT